MGSHLTRPLGLEDYAEAAALLSLLSDGDPVGSTGAFAKLLDHPGTTIFGSFTSDRLAAVVTLHLLPNMTRQARSYALIENVVCAAAYRGQGHAAAAMRAAIDTAWAADAYKIMLLTGQNTGAKGFYETLGFRADQKFGMQMRRVPPRDAAP